MMLPRGTALLAVLQLAVDAGRSPASICASNQNSAKDLIIYDGVRETHSKDLGEKLGNPWLEKHDSGQLLIAKRTLELDGNHPDSLHEKCRQVPVAFAVTCAKPAKVYSCLPICCPDAQCNTPVYGKVVLATENGAESEWMCNGEQYKMFCKISKETTAGRLSVGKC